MEKSRLALIREERGWSQEKLAEVSGLSREYISTLETSSRVNPTKKTMEKISKALKRKPEEIFFT